MLRSEQKNFSIEVHSTMSPTCQFDSTKWQDIFIRVDGRKTTSDFDQIPNLMNELLFSKVTTLSIP